MQAPACIYSEMPWYELTSADDPKLNELAKKYDLHPLHLEDARSPDERIKVDQTSHYTFAVLKPVRLGSAPGGGEETVAVLHHRHLRGRA